MHQVASSVTKSCPWAMVTTRQSEVIGVATLELMAEKDRKRYALEKADYIPPPDLPKKKKKKKDPNAPKRPMSGFMFFSGEKRASVKASLPEGHAFGDVGKARPSG